MVLSQCGCQVAPRTVYCSERMHAFGGYNAVGNWHTRDGGGISMQQDLVFNGSFNARRLRGILAEERITHRRFAEVCGLNGPYLSRILAGSSEPGELAIIKIGRGLAALGLGLERERDRIAM